nr:unnamed protein product [uncultured bacterium]
MKKTAPDGAVSGMPAIRETGPGKNLQAITVSCIIPPVQRKSASFLCLQSACRIGPWVLTCCVDLCSGLPFSQSDKPDSIMDRFSR